MTYYERHGERIKERFRRRYNADPSFREATLKRVAEYKKKKRAEQKRIKEQSKSMPRVWRPMNVGGVLTQCCRVGYLAVSLERSVQTLHLWEKAGNLPKSIRYKGQRYYTQPHYEFIVRCWHKAKGELEPFFQLVREGWNAVKLT